MEIYAFELQCNQSEVAKVAESLCLFHKVDQTCTIIPYGMKQEDPQQYNQWIYQQNTFLEESVQILLFGLHPEALKTRVKYTDKHPTYTQLKIAFAYSDSILGLEETNKTEELGKWFVLTNTTHEKEAKDFLDFTLPKLFADLDVEDVLVFTYPHFPHL